MAGRSPDTSIPPTPTRSLEFSSPRIPERPHGKEIALDQTPFNVLQELDNFEFKIVSSSVEKIDAYKRAFWIREILKHIPFHELTERRVCDVFGVSSTEVLGNHFQVPTVYFMRPDIVPPLSQPEDSDMEPSVILGRIPRPQKRPRNMFYLEGGRDDSTYLRSRTNNNGASTSSSRSSEFSTWTWTESSTWTLTE